MTRLARLPFQYLVRQSGVFALVTLLFAICQAGRVAPALWHGVGLHGDFLEYSTAKPYSTLMSVWDTLLQAVAAAVIGGIFLVIAIRSQKRARADLRDDRGHRVFPRRR